MFCQLDYTCCESFKTTFEIADIKLKSTACFTGLNIVLYKLKYVCTKIILLLKPNTKFKITMEATV